MSGIWREDSNAEWVLTDLLDKLEDKTREGMDGSEHSPNNRQGMTYEWQAGLGERPESPVQDGRLPESSEGSEAGGRRLDAVAWHTSPLHSHSKLVMSEALHRQSSVADPGSRPVAQPAGQDRTGLYWGLTRDLYSKQLDRGYSV